MELSWDSGDDLDLEVREPDGDVVSRDNESTKAGELNNDNNVGSCDISPAGKEAILYRNRVPIMPGEYTATIRHFNNCGNGSTKWRLRIVIDGEIVLIRNGNSNANDNAVIGSEPFSV